MTTQAKPHGFVTKTIHWLSAGLIGYGYLKGLENVSQLSDPALLRFEVAFALFLGGLFAVRYFWTRHFAGASRLPDSAPGWEKHASRAVHLGLYGAVFGIVISGLGIALGYSLPLLGGIFLAGMITLHEFALALLPLILAAHILGALWHWVFRKDGVMESMVSLPSRWFGRATKTQNA